LNVARGDVVEHDEAADVLVRFLGGKELAGLLDDDGEFELVIEFARQVFG